MKTDHEGRNVTSIVVGSVKKIDCGDTGKIESSQAGAVTFHGPFPSTWSGLFDCRENMHLQPKKYI